MCSTYFVQTKWGHIIIIIIISLDPGLSHCRRKSQPNHVFWREVEFFLFPIEKSESFDESE